MSAQPSPDPAVAFSGRTAATRLGAALLAGLALVAVLGAISRARVSELEGFAQSTGFGDTHYFPLPPEPRPTTPIVHLEGGSAVPPVPLFLANGETLERRDIRMIRVGHDKATGWTVYQANTAADGKKDIEREKSKGKAAYYLKAGPDHYVKLRPGKG
ncbi:MAG: hypothetical protein V4710_23340 [Verrucomicrobiota bacterium]